VLSLKYNGLKAHFLWHLQVLIVFLLVALVYFDVHLIYFLAVGTIFTRAVLPALQARCIARAVLFIALCFLACAVSDLII
jgi:hypothetical protein